MGELEMDQSISEADLKRYFELTNQKKEIEREINILKKQFHDELDRSFGKQQKGEIQSGLYKVQRQIRQSVSYHPEKTLQKLEELNLGDFIEVVKRPNTDKLEAAIKLGLVEGNEFENCTNTRTTQAIAVKLVE